MYLTLWQLSLLLATIMELMNDGLEPSKPTKKRKKRIDTKKMSDTLIKMINREPVSEDEVEEVVK